MSTFNFSRQPSTSMANLQLQSPDIWNMILRYESIFPPLKDTKQFFGDTSIRKCFDLSCSETMIVLLRMCCDDNDCGC